MKAACAFTSPPFAKRWAVARVAGLGYCFVAPISRSSDQVQVEAFVASTAGVRAVRAGLANACWRPWACLACSSGSAAVPTSH